MSIVKMQKLSLCANKKNRKAILELLQSMGIMEIDVSDLEGDEELQTMDTQSARSKYEKRADAFDQALKKIREYAPDQVPSGGLFAGKDKVERAKQAEEIKNRHEFNVMVEEIQKAERRIAECDGIIQKNRNAKESLVPWMSLDIPMNAKGTKTTEVLIGTLPGSVSESELYAIATKEMPEPAAVTAKVLSAENDQTCVTLICLKKDLVKVEENLRSAGFARPAIQVDGIPKDVAEACDRESEAAEKEKEDLKAEIASYSKNVGDFRIMADYYRDRADKYRLLGGIPQSENAFFLEGWVPQDQADRLAKVLSEKYGALVEKEEKREDEMEPTVLKNNRFSEAAEGVLESYGLPQQGKVDPTFIMSIFYVIFFGMMLSDAGYGLVMAIATFVVLKKKGADLEPGMKKMMKLFFWCGLSTMFWGFMYGGFFGDAIDTIAKTFFGYTGDGILKPLWFEPLKNPMRLLMYCMLFGVIHLYVGLGIKGYEYLKEGDIVGFISDIVSWYLFLTGLIFMLLPSNLFSSIAGQQFVFPAWVGTAAKVAAIVGLVIILLMSGRRKKNWALRIALGAYDIYGVTSWLSDVLSYSRLLALGLATGVIASVINMMAAMGGRSVVGVIIFILVFVLGHTLNLGINALGAYVHTNRLQYVEFFGKFYEGGGRKFEPFKSNSKYVQVKEGESL